MSQVLCKGLLATVPYLNELYQSLWINLCFQFNSMISILRSGSIYKTIVVPYAVEFPILLAIG